MKEVRFSSLEKKFPKKAEEFVVDQETVALFLNSPVRNTWMKFLKLSYSEIKKINKIVDYYGGLKVKEENKKKPKIRKQIIKIEDLCLKKIFLGRFIEVNEKNKAKALEVVKRLLKKEYPKSVILDGFELSKLSVLTGADGIKGHFSTDFLVLNPDKNKIIAVSVLLT